MSSEHREREQQLHTDSTQTSVLHDIMMLVLKIVVVAACFVLLFAFVYGIFRNNDISMKPSIKDGDLVIYYRLDHEFVVSDVAVILYNGKLLTSRVVASAGDTVDITEDGLVINGALQQETGTTGATNQYAEGISFPLKVGEGQVFVLGDNRENATDGRIFGPVNISDIKGKVITIIRRRDI